MRQQRYRVCAVCLVLSWQHMRDKFAVRPRNRGVAVLGDEKLELNPLRPGSDIVTQFPGHSGDFKCCCCCQCCCCQEYAYECQSDAPQSSAKLRSKAYCLVCYQSICLLPVRIMLMMSMDEQGQADRQVACFIHINITSVTFRVCLPFPFPSPGLAQLSLVFARFLYHSADAHKILQKWS